MASTNPTDNEHSAQDSNTETANHSHKAKATAAAILTQPTPQPCSKHPEITCNIKHGRIDKFTLCLEAFGLFVLIVYTVFTGLMYRANKESADAAKRAADTAQDTLVRTQRPWVGLKGFFLPVKVLPNVSLKASFLQTNSGHGPAFSVGNRVAFGVSEQELTVDLAESKLTGTKRLRYSTVFPGLESPEGQTSVTVNDGWMRQVNDGKAWLYYFGDIVYGDEFKQTHRTKFCSVYSPSDKQFHFCDVFNDAD